MLCDVIVYLDTWKIVLSWGKVPSDLDAYLVLSEPSSKHVSYDNKKVQSKYGTITLDTDSKVQFGYETISSK